jgi:hypothetical protein
LKKRTKKLSLLSFAVGSAMARHDKSFWLLFSKKEALAYVDNHDLIFIVTASAEIP